MVLTELDLSLTDGVGIQKLRAILVGIEARRPTDSRSRIAWIDLSAAGTTREVLGGESSHAL
jgi:hypothetical protein